MQVAFRTLVLSLLLWSLSPEFLISVANPRVQAAATVMSALTVPEYVIHNGKTLELNQAHPRPVLLNTYT